MNDPWDTLRRFTQARIAQGRSGSSLPTSALLDFQLAHAMARDAIHQPWDIERLSEAVKALGVEPLCLATPVADRVQYLQRPDLGRCLDVASRQTLLLHRQPAIDVVLTISNGLSSIAVESHGLALLRAIMAVYSRIPLRCGPVCLVPNARVALADQIGELLNARLSVIVVGERPGLSAADSLGVYLTYAPRVGNTDAERNCISNIRPPEGLSYQTAATKLAYLSHEALQRKVSGVALKDDMPSLFLG
ncbi:ethanolamine ammonia-lyase subunit EutC [Methylomicrobium sp. Wu6]|uniref:ethanolamine ammonia-lyase subunit EutC n=1 Tax=Methylomicrobium sp. Wu6 TaxID=3107928 RepID=UPI002DD63911|nr:ethanolamine ammonia-lyase subunit EutC [Methylomicrobium sp. Wu6]MEC4749135.1 ethanolamine ammonia-lyase subunit EutC [Methylomicrobium sp. Wu6]